MLDAVRHVLTPTGSFVAADADLDAWEEDSWKGWQERSKELSEDDRQQQVVGC